MNNSEDLNQSLPDYLNRQAHRVPLGQSKSRNLQNLHAETEAQSDPCEQATARFEPLAYPVLQLEPTIRLEAHEVLIAEPDPTVNSTPQSKSYPQVAPTGIPPLNPTWPADSNLLRPQWLSNPAQTVSQKPVAEANTKKYTIACIDDSPAVLQAINSFLDDKSFSVILISDPIKALMQIIRNKPDLILLDVTMPNLDGYELCSLLRKNSNFRGTPIVMVTGNTGFIDRAKARLVGSSGYLTKPFTQTDLIKMVFRHLS